MPTSRMTRPEWQRIQSGSMIKINGEPMKVPGSEGQYFTLYELLDEYAEHTGWEWSEASGCVTDTWVKAALPAGSKYIGVFLNKENYEHEVKNGMKPIIDGSFMPVFVAIECGPEGQKCPEPDEDLYLHN